jgi:hypothetical protein
MVALGKLKRWFEVLNDFSGGFLMRSGGFHEGLDSCPGGLENFLSWRVFLVG